MADDGKADSPFSSSLLPYEGWINEAYHRVMIQALDFASQQGLPGEHHFYITFRTDHPKTVIPPRLKAQYPQEITIVLQHQFWDLKVNHATSLVSVGLSFGGVGSTLVIPFEAITAFADPAAMLSFQFQQNVKEDAVEGMPDFSADEIAEPLPAPPDEEPPPAARKPVSEETGSQVVSLDAFRNRTP